MQKLSVQIDFSRMRDASLETRGGVIVLRMTGNESFNELAPDVAAVQAAHVSYARSLADSAGGGSLAVAIKEESRAFFETALHDLGVKINLKARGNQPLLESTGYPLVGAGKGGKKTMGDLLDKPGSIDLTIRRGTGTVGVTIEPVEGAAAYDWEYTEAPVTAASKWVSIQTTDFDTILSGFTIGTEYAFRVAGIAKNHNKVFSDIIVSHVI